MKRASLVLFLSLTALALVIGWWLFGRDGGQSLTPSDPRGTQPDRPIEAANVAPTDSAPAELRPVREADTRDDPEGADRDAPLIDFEGPPGAIHGRILNPDGEPIHEAEVELVRGPAAAVSIPSLWTRLNLVVHTDPQGKYRFTTVAPNDDYIVIASHSDFGNCEAGPIVVQPSTNKDAGDLRLRDGVLVQGYVRCDGRPIPNALVTMSNAMDRLRKLRPDMPVHPDTEPFDVSTVTDADGHYTFASAPFSTFELTVTADGFSKMTKASQGTIFGGSSREHEINFDLTIAARIGGMVVDEGKNGIAGAKVTATIANQTFRCEIEATTDPTGRFELAALALGDYFISATCDGFSESHQQQVAANSDSLVIEMRVQGSCIGVVVDEETGRAVTEFALTVYQQHKGRGPVEVLRNIRRSDSGGRFELKNLDPGSYVIEGTAAGYAASMSAEFEVDRGQAAAGIRVALHRGGTVVGTVFDQDGKPVRNASVQLRENGTKDNQIIEIFSQIGARGPTTTKARTRDDGSFALELVVPDTYQVSIKHNQYAPFQLDDVVVIKGESVDVGRLVIVQGARISGHAYDLDGRPLAQATVTAIMAKSAGYKSTRTDADGAYELRCLNAGEYTVTINSFQTNPPQNPLVGLSYAKNSRQIVPVVNGDDLTVDLRLMKNDPVKVDKPKR